MGLCAPHCELFTKFPSSYCAKQVTVKVLQGSGWLVFGINLLLLFALWQEGLEIVWTLEQTLWCLDSALKVSGMLACGLLMQNKSKHGLKVHFLRVLSVLRKALKSPMWYNRFTLAKISSKVLNYGLLELSKAAKNSFFPSHTYVVQKYSLFQNHILKISDTTCLLLHVAKV